MSDLAWRLDVQREAGTEDDPARPQWSQNGTPVCDETCPHHDGRRCRVLGFRAPEICEPVVVQMGRMLSAGPRAVSNG